MLSVLEHIGVCRKPDLSSIEMMLA